ncbi:hypothetical protein Ciccas_012655 [Cichlidogyrus casuarinus]|uniref:14-3-3 domain-containing protein n=1 Tax=Cichlidogyrus casuarinus TaxID=1844966 RepID=A0ABD2PMS3_9PLAT
MVKYMKSVAQSGNELNVKERNLLSVAYKNVIGARRASWRFISDIENKNRDKDIKRAELAEHYRFVIEDELKDICNEVLDLVSQHLLPSATAPDAKFAVTTDRHKAAEDALIAYKEATKIAREDLSPTHPIRLGLALNFSVFFYEILSSPSKACELAKAAFDEAVSQIDTMSEELYKDSTLILQLLKDNLSLWTADEQQDYHDDA